MSHIQKTKRLQRQKRKPQKALRTFKKPKEKAFRCGVQHTSKLRLELENMGLGLSDTSAKTQCHTLLRILEYRGSLGMNTLEGMACGFIRLATRIQELEELGYPIESRRESAIGADGLLHHGIARYVLLSDTPTPSPQASFDLEVVL
jgi:hypothetical protein